MKPIWRSFGANKHYCTPTKGRLQAAATYRICEARPWYGRFRFFNGHNLKIGVKDAE